jgi:type II secretory pathway component GspD/PulD (secretin)
MLLGAVATVFLISAVALGQAASKPTSRPAEPPAVAPEKALAAKLTNIRFASSAFQDAIDLCRKSARTNIVIDLQCQDQLRTPITLELDQATLRQVLLRTLKIVKLKFRVQDGVIYIYRNRPQIPPLPAVAAGVPEWEKQLRKKLAAPHFP